MKDCEKENEENGSSFKKSLNGYSHMLSMLSALCLAIFLCSSNFLSSQGVEVAREAIIEKLENPCALAPSNKTPFSVLDGGLRNESEARRMVILSLIQYTNNLKAATDETVATDLLGDCEILKLDRVASIPSADEIREEPAVELLKMFYSSLVNHTVHVYFLREQSLRYPVNTTICAVSRRLSERTGLLAIHMREVLCHLWMTIVGSKDWTDGMEDFFQNSTAHIADENLFVRQECSRRTLQECAIVGSTAKLLEAMTSYLDYDKLMEEVDPVTSTTTMESQQ